MRVQVREGSIAKHRAGALALGLFERQGLGEIAQTVDRASRGSIRRLLARRDFSGTFLETLVLYPTGLGAPRLILVGLGPLAAFSPARALQAAAIAVRRARDIGAGTLATEIFGLEGTAVDGDRAAQLTAEGAVLGTYRFTAYRAQRQTPALKRV